MLSRAGVLMLALGLGVLPAGCLSEKACTLIGCRDQVTLSFTRPDGAWPGLSVELQVDGRSVGCAVPANGPSPSTACDASDVSVSAREEQECHEERTAYAISRRCMGTGRFAEEITILGTPQTLHLLLLDRDVRRDEKTFVPAYKTSRPNGPDCDPTCRQWSTSWVLPDDPAP